MKFKTLLISCLATLTLAPSCIKEEGLDREADILSITIEDKAFVTALINEYTHKVSLIMEGDISNYENGIIVPTIETSSRSKISPESATPVQLKDYTQFYTVTAEDGSSKRYAVAITVYDPLVQGFEEWYQVKTNPKRIYDMPVDDMWKTANPGVIMLYRDYEPFPTRRSSDKYPGSEGQYSVELETVMGSQQKTPGLMDIPIYAGNMFRGEFNVGAAMIDPLTTTKFGQPHPEYFGKPLVLTAWYKYKSGDKFQNWKWENEEKESGMKMVYIEEGKLDKPDIYAILYKVAKGDLGRKEFLTAKDIKTSDKIVATAIMQDTEEKEDWTRAEIKFTYSVKELDYTKYDYKLAVVLSSSEAGAYYKGAIGSLLTVDDLRVVFENDPDAHLYK